MGEYDTIRGEIATNFSEYDKFYGVWPFKRKNYLYFNGNMGDSQFNRNFTIIFQAQGNQQLLKK